MPHHVLAMGTVLAALGAKAAGSGVDPTSFIGTGAAPLSKGMGSVLLSLKASKAAAAAASPTGSSFLAHAGDVASGAANTAGVTTAAPKAAAAAAAAAGGPGKTALSMLAAKGSATGGLPTPTAAAAGVKGAGGGAAATAHPSMLKIYQKTCLRKRRAGLMSGGKAKPPRTSAAAGRGGASGHGASHAGSSPHAASSSGGGHTAQAQSHQTSAHTASSGGGGHTAQAQPHQTSAHAASSSGGGHTAQAQPHQTSAHAPPHASGGGPRATGSGGGSGYQGPLTGQGGPSADARLNYSGAPPGGAEGGEEVMPGSLSSSSTSKFLQLHKGPPSTAASFTRTSAPPPNAYTGAGTAGAGVGHIADASGAAAAAAAAADHAADVSNTTAMMRPPDFDTSGIGMGGAAGMDPEMVGNAAAAAPSKGSSILKGFMQGALGIDSTGGGGGMLQNLSSGVGSGLLNNWWGNGALAGGTAAAIGAAAADPTLGAIDPTMAAVDPTLEVDPVELGDPTEVDPEVVEEQTMAIASLLPSLFGRMNIDTKHTTASSTGKRRGPLVRSHSVASTACASDGAGSDSGAPEGEGDLFSSRRVYRSRAGDRKTNYAQFLC